MKDYNQIEKLLERFYNAETSEAEEQMLKDFFLNEEVPPHLQAEKEIFVQLYTSDIPYGMEKRLGKLIDEWEVSEQKTQKKPRIYHLQWIGSIAASLLLLFGAGWYLQEPTRKDTCSTPEEAYAEAQRALAMFSTALNKGMKQMDVLHKTTERVEKIFTYNETH